MRENELIDWISQNVGKHPSVPLGIGDDMAMVHVPTGEVLLKIDQALDQVHFDLRTHSPAQAGRKAVNRCLSDCAAMACLPAAFLVSVALPRGFDVSKAKELFIGCRDAAAVFDCPLVGGDTAVWDQRLAISVAAMGASTGRTITRNTAEPGDAICVSGQLGGSILSRHMNFVPRVKLSRELIHGLRLHALMDISDGLAMDLQRLLSASKCGATIYADKIPIHPDAIKLAETDGKPAIWHAMCDGEDYELLFTISISETEKLKTLSLEAPISVIGTINKTSDIVFLDKTGAKIPWPEGGWEHGAMENREPQTVDKTQAI